MPQNSEKTLTKLILLLRLKRALKFNTGQNVLYSI
jgi:hypothetical protein